MSEQAVFLKGSLLRHITVMSLTASVGLMAVFIVDFVDIIFISMLGKSELAAAVGYAGAILFFTTSFGIGMAIAAGALVARALGEGDEDGGDGGTQQNAQEGTHHNGVISFLKEHSLCHESGVSIFVFSLFCQFKFLLITNLS